MPDKYWDTEVEMVEVQKDNFSVYKVHACTKNGKNFINIREWYWTSNDPIKKPGKQGMCFPITNNGDICSCLIASLQQARVHFEKEGLL